METGVLFNALDTAINCSAATLGTWGGETIKPKVDLLLVTPEMWGRDKDSKGAGK